MTGPAPTRARTVLVALCFWIAGMILAHGPMIFSGLAKVQGNLGVPRMLTYVLEHDYRWLTGDPLHRSFWDPPMFYPAKNTAAYSETLLGAAPLYWVWRAVGVPIDVAYPLWLLAVSSLNFLAAFLFLRDAMARSAAASGFGAFLFSFGSMRLGYIGLTQLLPGFYFVLALHALARLFREEDRTKALRWTALLALAFLGQAYTCFYIAWFLGLGLGLAAFWSLALPAARPEALAALRRHGPGLAAAAIAVGIGMIPFLVHSLRAAAEVGMREYDEVEIFLPRPESWLHFGREHWIFGGLSEVWPFNRIPTRASEHAIGFGPVSSVLAVVGLWNLRRTTLGRMLGAVAASLFVMTLLLPGGWSLWALIFLVVPGAGAIRAVGRVSLLILLPASAGAAAVLDESRWRKPLLAVLAVVSLLEQGRTSPVFDRREARESTAAIVRRLDPAADAFLLTEQQPPPSANFINTLPLRTHVDAMMASLEARVPTINGYSGWTPPGWPFEAATVVSDEAAAAGVERMLQEWCARSRADRRRIQWIR
jgi:hypothetical protein